MLRGFNRRNRTNGQRGFRNRISNGMRRVGSFFNRSRRVGIQDPPNNVKHQNNLEDPPPPDVLTRIPSYNSTYTIDTEGDKYLSSLTNGYYDNFVKTVNEEQTHAIDVYQIVKECEIIHKALDIGKLELYNKVAQELHKLPYNGTDDENKAMEYIRERTIPPNYVKIVKDLDDLFETVPVTPVPLTTYRCYAWNIGLDELQKLFDPTNKDSNKRYISTSLSRLLVEKWCINGNKKLRIRILIPQGSKGVVPLLLFKKENFRQNEITLARTGGLKYSGFNDNNNYPICVYVKDKTESIDQYIPMIKAGNYNLIKKDPHFNESPVSNLYVQNLNYEFLGGKRTTKKRKFVRRNFQ
jgi:hypothetical protein